MADPRMTENPNQGGGGGQEPAPHQQPIAPQTPVTFEQLAWLFGQRSQESHPKTVRMKEPDAFDGKGIHARNFLMECELYIEANAHQFPQDTSKILFVLSYCKEGSALSYREHVVNSAKANKTYGTFLEFTENFRKAFITSDDKGEAMRELQKHKQIAGVDAYIQRFKMLISRAGITDFEASKTYFVTGLGTNLLNRIMQQPVLPEDNMEAWYALVQSFDRTERYIQSLKGGRPTGGTYTTKVLPPGEPMEIDAVRLSKEDHERYMKEGRCFNCAGTGHIGRNCSKPKPKWTKPSNGQQSKDKGSGSGNKLTQVRTLLKDLSAEDRKKIMDEFKGDTMTRIRALMQELPEEEKEQVAEEAMEGNFP